MTNENDKDKVNCACPACNCIIEIVNAIKDKAGKLFCSKECAEGHTEDTKSKDNNSGGSCNCGCNRG